MAQALQRLNEENAEARPSLQAPRLVWQGGGIVAEDSLDLSEVSQTFGGVPLRRGADVGLVNAFVCPLGLRQDDQATCTVAADPRGFGLGERAQ